MEPAGEVAMNVTIRRYLQQIGRKGGSVKGPQKRTRTSGKVAADARWAKRKRP